MKYVVSNGYINIKKCEVLAYFCVLLHRKVPKLAHFTA